MQHFEDEQDKSKVKRNTGDHISWLNTFFQKFKELYYSIDKDFVSTKKFCMNSIVSNGSDINISYNFKRYSLKENTFKQLTSQSKLEIKLILVIIKKMHLL